MLGGRVGRVVFAVVATGGAWQNADLALNFPCRTLLRPFEIECTETKTRFGFLALGAWRSPCVSARPARISVHIALSSINSPNE